MNERNALLTVPAGGMTGASALGEVVDVADPEKIGRVRIRLLNADGIAGLDGPIWARVAVPFAGDGYGAFLLPDVGEQVLVTFLRDDPRFPIVLGSLWHGGAAPPESPGGAGDRVDRWTFTGKAGTRIAIVEENGGSTITVETANGVSGEWTDDGGGSIILAARGATITIDGQGVRIKTPAKVQIKASQVDIEAPTVNVNAAIANFSNVVKCQVLEATVVVGTMYAPGVGNIW